MRLILINEEQALKIGLLEDNDVDSPIFDGDNNLQYPGANAPSGLGTIIADRDGEDMYDGEGECASPPTSQKIANQQSIQTGWNSRAR